MTTLRTLALAATGPLPMPLRDDFPDGGDIILRWGGNRADYYFHAAASPAVVLALLDVVDAARVLVQHGDCREDDDIYALRAALAKYEEVTRAPA